MNTERGFTLIELMVVVAIIGLLSSIVLSSLNTARVKAKDARRMADIAQIRNALEFYAVETGTYPGEVACDSSKGSDPGSCIPLTGTNWSATSQIWMRLVPTYIIALPVDPINSGNYYYNYEPNVGGSDYCIGAALEGGGRFMLKGGPTPVNC